MYTTRIVQKKWLLFRRFFGKEPRPSQIISAEKRHFSIVACVRQGERGEGGGDGGGWEGQFYDTHLHAKYRFLIYPRQAMRWIGDYIVYSVFRSFLLLIVVAGYFDNN